MSAAGSSLAVAATLTPQVAATIGFGPITHDSHQDHFVEGQRVYTLHLRLGRVAQLQRQHGTGMVSYSPHPLLAVTIDKGQAGPARPELLLIITGGAESRRGSLYKLLSHLRKSFSDIIHLEYDQLRLSDHLPLFHKAGFILLYDVEQDPQLGWLALGSCTPFCQLGARPIELTRVCADVLELPQMAPEARLDDYYQLKKAVAHCLQARSEMRARVIPYIKKVRSLLVKWAARSVGFRAGVGVDPSPRYAPLPIAVSPADYAGHSPQLARLAEELATTPGGIHLEMASLYSFTEGLTGPYLHPWLGVVEEVGEAVKRLVGSRIFVASSPACISLLVFDYDSQLELKTALDVVGIEIPVRVVPMVLMREAPSFNCSLWAQDPRISQLPPGGQVAPEPNCIPVLTGSKGSSQIFGPYYDAIANVHPLVCAPTWLARYMLGSDYPLFTDDLEPFQLRDFVTVERVTNAIIHLEGLSGYLLPAAWLEKLRVTRLGTLLHRITRG